MQMQRSWLIALILLMAGFIVGRWSGPVGVVKADGGDNPQIDVREIGGSSSLVVFYPGTKKLFVYQPFAGMPTWPCAYSIQLSTPGGTVNRQPCPAF